MEYSPRLALNLDVIKFALPQLATILIEFAPVFISFSIVGMTSFSQSERFADLSSTVVKNNLLKYEGRIKLKNINNNTNQ